jgi:tetratricopeptide (TPR) repeat protein
MDRSDEQVRELVERVLETGIDATLACADAPELLPAVRARLGRVRALASHVDSLFPSARHVTHDHAAMPVIPGYALEETIGHGGMGVVYRAIHLKLKRRVAIKMLLAGGYAGPGEIARFKREAESVAALCHPNVVQVFDAGECDGRPYFVMEYMGGGTLADELRGEPQPIAKAIAAVTLLASAVQAAHVSGIVHRDLKPSNVLRSEDGALKVADFGLAGRFGNDEASDVTLAGARLGTPSYMAPEQARGSAGAFCPLVDVYALGAILYEMLTGRPPFRGASAAETTRLVLETEAVPPSRLNPSIPRDLETICLSALAKDPARRYPSAADLGEDLARFARGDAIRARPERSWRRAVRVARRHPAATALAITLASAAAAALVAAEQYRERERGARVEASMRQHDARQAVSSAVAQAWGLRALERWAEAEEILARAEPSVADADSEPLADELREAMRDVRAARELDRIRRSYPQPDIGGFTYGPAADDYVALFETLGIAIGVPLEDAAATVRASGVREALLRGLESAAFVERVQGGTERVAFYLDVARAADPQPWRDRFRSQETWHDRQALLALVNEAESGTAGAESHQLVIAAVLLSGLGENDRTIELLKVAQARNPSDFWTNLELGNALKRAGRFAEATQFYRAAVAVQPSNFVAWTVLGFTLDETGQLDDAIAAHGRAVEMAPDCAAAWLNLSVALSEAGRWDESIRYAREARERFADRPEMRTLLFHVSVARGRAAAARTEWDEARRAYVEARPDRVAGDTEVAFEEVATALLAGDIEAYLAESEDLLEAADLGAERRYLAARACTLAPGDARRMERVAEVAERELAAAPDTHWARAEQGALAFRRGDLDAAERHVRASVESNGDPNEAAVAWAWLANVRAARGDAVGARAELGRLDAAIGGEGAAKPDAMHIHNWLEIRAVRAEALRRLEPGSGPSPR